MSRCSEIDNEIGEYKSQIDAAFQELNRIRGLVASAASFDELQELSDRRSAATTQSNRAGNLLFGLLSAAQAANCGPALESRIKSEINYSEQVSRQLRDLGSTITQKQQNLQIQNATKENNAGTGTPGTAGQGPTATPDSDQLEELEIQSKRVPEPVSNPNVDPNAPPQQVPIDGLDRPPQINVGDELSISDPILPDQVNIDQSPPPNINTANGLQGQKANARAQATIQDTTNFEQFKDWRVRLALSPGADYLYKAPEGQRGILDPLSKTNGVVFPYTPSITVSYAANYDEVTPTHSNYKILQYTNSMVDMVTISCDFTAQDVLEANYLLAVIHFFRSVTKMWYGQDQFPKPGTPPPLVYLFGLGEFQFNAHPLVVKNFTYALPNDVDYIRAGTPTTNPGVNKAPSKQTEPTSTSSGNRLKQVVVQIGKNFLNNILPGGEPGPANFTPSGFNAVIPAGTVEPTYVPTKINLVLNCQPIVSRNEISNNFSLKDYGTGKLLRGVQRSGGGFW